jgi:hypothetical protein
MASPLTPRPEDNLEERARSVPYRSCYVTGVALCLVYYLCLVGVVASLVALVRIRDPAPGIMLTTFVLLSVVFWFLSFVKRRDATCPLCKGTPLLDTQALTHRKAKRIFPLNYGTSNVLSIVLRHRFRCQFCGIPYDLLKNISPPRDPSPQVIQSLDRPDLPPAVIPPIAGSVATCPPQEPSDPSPTSRPVDRTTAKR